MRPRWRNALQFTVSWAIILVFCTQQTIHQNARDGKLWHRSRCREKRASATSANNDIEMGILCFNFWPFRNQKIWNLIRQKEYRFSHSKYSLFAAYCRRGQSKYFGRVCSCLLRERDKMIEYSIIELWEFFQWKTSLKVHSSNDKVMCYRIWVRCVAWQISIAIVELYNLFCPLSLFHFHTSTDITQAHKNHRLCSLIGVEGGHSLGGSLGVLRTFYTLGVRYMTLTSTCHTPWADSSNADAPKYDVKHGGLTPYGKVSQQYFEKIMLSLKLKTCKRFWYRHIFGKFHFVCSELSRHVGHAVFLVAFEQSNNKTRRTREYQSFLHYVVKCFYAILLCFQIVWPFSSFFEEICLHWKICLHANQQHQIEFQSHFRCKTTSFRCWKSFFSDDFPMRKLNIIISRITAAKAMLVMDENENVIKRMPQSVMSWRKKDSFRKQSAHQ